LRKKEGDSKDTKEKQQAEPVAYFITTRWGITKESQQEASKV
jgi:hypothetical protein